jgi:polyhydroxyalkanoate synthesis regulator phasin
MAKKDQSQELQESAQQIFLAGLGALAKAEEEGSKVFQKLVKRGKNYDGPGAEQADALRDQIESQIEQFRNRAEGAQKQADRQAKKARSAVNQQVDRARQSLENALEGFENQLEAAVSRALKGLGVPTRDEFTELQKSLRQLSKNIDAARREREIEDAAAPPIDARSTGGGWYEIRVHGLVVDRVRGEEEAAARVEQLRAQDFSTTAPETQTITIDGTGGGWYEVRVDGIVVDKVQGRRAAEAAMSRIEQEA